MTTATVATDKQLSFINKLVNEKDWKGAAVAPSVQKLIDGQDLTKYEASKVIEGLLNIKVAEKKSFVLAEGFYALGEEIFKVQKSKATGKPYAKKLNPATSTFDYTPGAAAKLAKAEVLTLEVAQAFGKKYGVCCICARILTNPESIEAGIGPICAGKF